jgi:hypothetical protein
MQRKTFASVAEARAVLKAAAYENTPTPPQKNLAEVMLKLFGKKNGAKLQLPNRKATDEHRIPDFSSPEYDRT